MATMQGVVASVPVRVADVGGWTDTWFGAPGWVCHLAVGPGIRVEARLGDGPAGVRLRAPDLGLDWTPARQSGVQDQWAAAMGGAGLLRIDPYPDVVHTPIALSDETVRGVA